MHLGIFISEIKDQSLREKLTALHDDLAELIYSVPASVKYHHNWTGGYADHVRQVLEHAVGEFHRLHTNKETKINRSPEYTLDDIILVAFIHDLDKLYRYKKLEEPKDGREWEYVKPYPSYSEITKVVSMCALYGILLKDMHLAALDLHHGGWSDRAKSGGQMTPLATILHCADLMSTHLQTRKGD